MNNFNESIKYQRENHGYTQNALAKATGIAQPKISYYESGQHIPPIDFCITLAQFYGITVDELIGLSDYQTALPTQPVSNKSAQALSDFDNEYAEIIADKNFIQTAKLYKAITPELRALAFGYIVGILQSNGVNTQSILRY